MKRWISKWLLDWRGQRFVVSSPLSIDDARRRLAASLAPHVAAAAYPYGHGLNVSAVVLGRLQDDRLRIELSPARGRNSFRPVLRGRLEATGAGCQLVCRLGWHPLVRFFAGVWFAALVASGATLGVAGLITGLGSGNGAAAAHLAMMAGACLGMALFGVAISVAGTWLSRDEGRRLRAWVSGRLHGAR